MNCLLILAGVSVLGTGVVLMLYGRNGFVRSVGALLSSAPGILLAWVSVRLMSISLDRQLWSHFPADGEVYVVGQDITFGELILIPLQNVGCFFILPALFLLIAPRLHRLRNRYHTLTDLLEDVIFGTPLARLLEKPSSAVDTGCLTYQVLIGMGLLLMLPMTGAIAYATLQLTLLDGQVHYFEDWIKTTTLGVCTVFGLGFFAMNEVIALRLFWPKAQAEQGET